MAGIIIDGTGSRRAAGVSVENRLLTESKSRPSEEIDAESGNSFILHSRCHTANTSSGGLLYLKNTSSTDTIFITRVYIDTFVLTNPIIVSLIKEPTTITGGLDITSTGIIQKNFGISQTLSATLLTSNVTSDITFTGGEEYHSFAVLSNTSQIREMKGTNILTPNTDVLWGWETESGLAVDGEIISLSVNLFVKGI